MAENGTYTIVLVPGDTQRTRSLKITPRVLRIGAALASITGLFLVLMLASWWYFAAQTARIPELQSQVAELEAENARVEELAETLRRLEAEYDKIRVMLGAEAVAAGTPPEMIPSRAQGREGDAPTPTGLSSQIPTSWPLASGGFVTQVLEQARAGAHPGVDIAVAQHSYIRASGAGMVSEAGFDSIYGLYVLIEHGNTGYQTMYGHASRLFVTPGESIRQNEVIALSGNTGVSTAPHLHFEVLQNGRPIDPLTLVQQRAGS